MNDQVAQQQRGAVSYALTRGCTGKIAHPSKKNARAVARQAGGTMQAYHCRLCGRWHVGHSNRRVSVA